MSWEGLTQAPHLVTALSLLFQQRVLCFNFTLDPANGRAGPASRPGWGSPGEDGLGELIPTTVVDPGPFPPLKSGLEIHLKPDSALLEPLAKWTENAAASQLIWGSGGESVPFLCPGP